MNFDNKRKMSPPQDQKDRTIENKRNKSNSAPSNFAMSSTSTVPAKGTSVNVENVKVDAQSLIHSYRDFLLESYGKTKVFSDIKTCPENYIRYATAPLRSVIKDKKVDIQSLEEVFSELLNNLETIKRNCNHLEQKLQDRNVTMQRVEDEGRELFIQIKEEIERDKLCEKQDSDAMERLGKVNQKIEFATSQRENNLICYSELDKVLSITDEPLNSCRMEIQEDEIKLHIQKIEQDLTELEAEHTQWMTENTAVLNALDQEKVQLREEMIALKDVTVEAEDKEKTLTQEFVQLAIKDTEQAKRLDKIQTDNEYLLENATSESKQKLLQLSNDLMALTEELAQLKSNSTTRRMQYEKLKQIITKIAKKKKSFDKLTAECSKLMAEVRKQKEDISVLQKFAKNETVDVGVDSPTKRQRLLSDEVGQIKSSKNVEIFCFQEDSSV